MFVFVADACFLLLIVRVSMRYRTCRRFYIIALAEVRRKEYHALTVGEGKNAEERLQASSVWTDNLW